jgi:hypothetical protein
MHFCEFFTPTVHTNVMGFVFALARGANASLVDLARILLRRSLVAPRNVQDDSKELDQRLSRRAWPRGKSFSFHFPSSAH